MSFFTLNLNHQFFLKLDTMIACNYIQYLVEVKLTEKVLGAQNWAKQAKTACNQVFCHFHQFSLLIFLEIAYNDSLQQSRFKICKKIRGPKFGPQLGLKLVFFAIFSSFVHQSSCKLQMMIAWNNVQLLAEVKSK